MIDNPSINLMATPNLGPAAGDQSGPKPGQAVLVWETASPDLVFDLLIFKKHFYIYVSRFEYAHVRKYIWSFAIIAFRKWHRLTGGDNYSVDVVSRLNIIHMRYEEREVSTTSQPVSHACMFQPIWARSRGSFLNALLASCCYKAPRVVITILWWSYWKCGEDVPKTNPKEREDVPEWVNNHIKPQVKETKQ